MTDLEIGSNNAAVDDDVGRQIPTVSKNLTVHSETKTKTNKKYNEKTKCVLKLARERATKGLGWFWKDMRKSHLLWVKIIFLFQSASLVSLYPYLTIHMRSLGFSIEDTALVNTAVPLADILGPPAAGLLADKLGNFGAFMGFVTALNGAASLALLFIPRVSSQEINCCSETECSPPLAEVGEMQILKKCSQVTNFTEAPATFNFSNTFDVENVSSYDDACPIGTTACVETVRVSSEEWMESFTAYMAVRIIIDILRASSLMLFEGAVVVIIKEHGGDYGLQKLFGTAGAVLFSPLAGKIIDISSSSADYEDYSGLFILYFLLRLVTAVLVLKLKLDFKAPAKRVFKDFGKVLRQSRVLIYLAAFLLAGLLWGFLETFLFWHLEDLGASKFLMGISLAVGTLAGLPLTVFSRLVIKNLGHHFVILLALGLYSVRLTGYSFLEIPEPVLLFEALKPFCTTLLLISAMTFIKDVTPMSTAATMEGVFGSLYFGVGRGLGGLLGAYLWEALGAVYTFRLFGAISASVAIFYAVAAFILRTRESEIAQTAEEGKF